MEYEATLDHSIPIEKYFEDISRIPRESGNEKAVSDYVVRFAEAHDLRWLRDDMWNVVVWKPASPGKEGAAPVILQAHMDMVCAKAAGCAHDFLHDPIALRLDNGLLSAEGTTLGADDGFGVAYMLAAMADDTLIHPPLECVFTVQEETGTVGAENLDKRLLSGRRMLNLDGDEEDATFVASSCSDRVLLDAVYETAPVCDSAIALKLYDFSNGTYQGVLHPECGNTVKMIARLLHRLQVSGISFRLSAWSCGTAENFNPLEGSAVFTADAPQEQVRALLRAEFSLMEKEIADDRYAGKMRIEPGVCVHEAISAVNSARLVTALWLMPNNLLHATEKETLTINNVGLVSLRDGVFHAAMSCRSKLGSCEEQVVRHCRELAQAFGLRTEVQTRYRPWPYVEHSPLRELVNTIAAQQYGYTLREEVCPGGLEIGYFFDGDDFDAVMLGPNLKNLHTPEESMEMASFHRVYDLLCRTLAQLD